MFNVPLCTPVYPCVPLCTPVYHCLPLCTPVYPCAPLCIPVYPGVPLCPPVYPYIRTPVKRNPPLIPLPPYLSSDVLPRVIRNFDVYPPLIVPWEKEEFSWHRSSCSALRAERARSGGVRARGETREGRGAMRDTLRKNLISPKPRKRPLSLAVVKTELPAWREMA